MTESSVKRSGNRKRPRFWILICLLLLLVVPHCVTLTVAALQDNLFFGKLDYVVILGTFVYLGIFILVVRSKKHVPQLVLITYATLVPLVAVGWVFEIMAPRAMENIPWQPRSHTSLAAGTMPGITGAIQFTANTYGVRGPEICFEDMDFRVLCVGGSTTECLYVTDKLSWPWRLQDKLASRLRKNVFVGNAGKSGHCTFNHDYLLRHYALVPEFDWVVVLCGINDCGRLLRNDYEERKKVIAKKTFARIYTDGMYYRRFALFRFLSDLAKRIFARAYNHTVVQDLSGEWYREKRLSRQAALKKNTFRRPPPELEMALARYRADVERIIDTCRELKLNLVMVTQPTLWRKNLPANLEALLMQHATDGAYPSNILEEVILSFNQSLQKECREQGVICVDLASMLPKDSSVFYDDCHFNISGCEKVATILCDALIAELEKDKYRSETKENGPKATAHSIQ